MDEAITLAPQDFIKTELAKFNIADATIAEMRENFLSIKVADHTDKFHAEVAHNRRMEVRALRINVEKTRKELKEGFLRAGQAIDAEAKRITALLTPIEEHLQEQEDIVAKHKARLEAEAKAKIEAEQEAERQRVEALKREVEEQFARLEEQRRAMETEKQRIETEKRHQEELDLTRKATAERAAFETEQRLKREAEAKVRAEQEEKERAARVAAARPDREKLVAFAEEISNLRLPEVESEAAKELVRHIVRRIDELANYISERANSLGVSNAQ